MNAWNRFIIGFFLISASNIALPTPVLLIKTGSYLGGEWLIERDNDVYTIKYKNPNGDLYKNNLIITSDIEGSNLSLDQNPDDTVSLIMNYPRDNYVFKFTSGTAPHIASACKQMVLPSINDASVTALTLCYNKEKIKNIEFSDISINNLLEPHNLFLEKKSKQPLKPKNLFYMTKIKIKKRTSHI